MKEHEEFDADRMDAFVRRALPLPDIDAERIARVIDAAAMQPRPVARARLVDHLKWCLDQLTSRPRLALPYGAAAAFGLLAGVVVQQPATESVQVADLVVPTAEQWIMPQ